MTTLLHAALGALLGWLIWRLAPAKLRGTKRNLPNSDTPP